MFGFWDSCRNEITLSQLLTSYSGERGRDNDIKEFLPAACRNALYADFVSTGTVSNVRNGKAYARFKDCADVFNVSNITEIANELFDQWNTIWKKIIAFDGDDKKKKISLNECARRIINGERKILGQTCPKILTWLDNALKLSDESYMQKIFTLLTILAITRDKPDECKNWRKMAELLTTGNFLPFLSSLPDNPSLESQQAFERCKNFYRQGDFAQAKKFLETALDENKPLWNSEVYRQLAQLRMPFDSPTDALKLFRTARKHIENALIKPNNDEYKLQLIKKWQEISSAYLAAAMKFFEQGGAEFICDFEKIFVDEDFCRHWHGEACFCLAQFYRSRDEEKFFTWLKHAVEANNHQAMNLQLEILWPINIEEPEPEAFAIAEQLQSSPFPQISGGAHYRLYLSAQNTKEAAKHLKAAYNCNFAPAVSKYNEGIVSYCDKISRSTYDRSGQCLLNVTVDNPLAKIFVKTVPENWSITYAIERKILSDAIKNLNGAQIICLLISDDEQKNLADFLFVMEMLKNPPSDSIIFIRGSQERLTPIVDTGLKQYFHGVRRPLLRVEILDDEIDAARELFSKYPLFLPLLKVKVAATLHFVAAGSACQYLTKEAMWFMTFPDELKITAKVSTFISDDISDELFKLTEQAVANGEVLYFAVDTGDDLRTLSLAIKIRELLTRTWLKHSVAPIPPAIPIAVRIKNPDFAFMSQRLIILGEEASGGSFNSYLLTNFGSYLRYAWKNLVQNNIHSRLALAVHMVYSNVHADKNFSDADCWAAFVDFSRRTYNQRSSLAVAQSLPYRLFVMSRLLDVKIFDDDLTNTDDIFSATTRKNFSANEMLTNLEKFYNMLKKIQAALSKLWANLNESHCLKNWQELSAHLDDFIACGKLSSCDQAENFLSKLNLYNCEAGHELNAKSLKSLLNQLTQLEEKIIRPQLEQIKKIFIWEHERWSAYLLHSQGWQPATKDEVIRYINAGNNGHHQNFLAKLHPCINLNWCHLKTLAQELEPSLNELKDFRKLDEQSILSTGEILFESVLRKDGDTPAHLRRLFCINRDELF